jgi:hypothetical protein
MCDRKARTRKARPVLFKANCVGTALGREVLTSAFESTIEGTGFPEVKIALLYNMSDMTGNKDALSAVSRRAAFFANSGRDSPLSSLAR